MTAPQLDRTTSTYNDRMAVVAVATGALLVILALAYAGRVAGWVGQYGLPMVGLGIAAWAAGIALLLGFGGRRLAGGIGSK